MKTRVPAWLAVTLALLLAGCTTVPAAQPADWWVGYLDPSATVYGQIKTAGASPALAPLLADKDMKSVIDRTTSLYFSLKPGKTEAGKARMNYRLLALGDYPLGWTGWYLGMQSAWKRVPGPLEQYHNPLAGLFAVNAEQGAVIASNEALTPENQHTAPKVDPALLKGLDQADLTLLMYRPGENLLGEKVGRLLPIVQAEASLKVTKTGYQGTVVLQMADEKSARGGFLMTKLLMSAWLEGVFEGAQPEGQPATASRASEIAGKMGYSLDGQVITITNFVLPFDVVAGLTAGLVPKKEAK